MKRGEGGGGGGKQPNLLFFSVKKRERERECFPSSLRDIFFSFFDEMASPF